MLVTINPDGSFTLVPSDRERKIIEHATITPARGGHRIRTADVVVQEVIEDFLRTQGEAYHAEELAMWSAALKTATPKQRAAAAAALKIDEATK